MEAELFKTIAHVAPPEQIPAGKWLTTLNALLKRDMQGGMDWLSQCKQALIKWSDRPQMEGTVAGAYLWDGTGENRQLPESISLRAAAGFCLSFWQIKRKPVARQNAEPPQKGKVEDISASPPQPFPQRWKYL